MKISPCLPRATAVAVLLLGVLGAPAHAQDASPLDRDEPYRYSVVDADIRRVLTDLGGNLGLAVSIDPAVVGRVMGPFPEASPREFLDRLAALNNFTYFFDGQVLHVTPASANESRLISLREVSFTELRDALASLGVLDQRFTLRRSGNGSVALAAGPPRYVALVEATLAALLAARPEPEAPAPATASGPLVLPPSEPRPVRPVERRQPLVVFRGSSVQVLPEGRPSAP